MKTRILAGILLSCVGLFAASDAPDQHEQNWTNYVRIGAYGLNGADALTS